MNWKIVPPDEWGSDWFGWLKSQAAHIFVGIFLVFVICMSFFFIFGQLPIKTHVLATIFVGYMIFKFTLQGWQRVDTIEDSVFLVGYGAAGLLTAAFEVEVGYVNIHMDLGSLLPFFCVMTVHVISRVLWMVLAK